ncbi:MAG TPA: SpoIIE family protein phosphatase [Acidimicrobiales bacterium]|nr:SpoIIE family protein phosphatase [Acidimicrobiales bacterium]
MRSKASGVVRPGGLRRLAPWPQSRDLPANGVAAGASGSGATRSWFRRRAGARPESRAARPAAQAPVASFEILVTDPLLAYLQESSGAVDINQLALESPALSAMRDAGVVLVVPLIASGELIGLLSLGSRLSERGYSTDDRQLLDALGSHAAPALRVGQLLLEQEAEARRRERIEQELVVAQLIQQQFLPKSLPDLPGWQVAAFYRPARTVGGDFYDFIELPDGRAMVVVGDVTDKGVPAALVMASTHAMLRSAAPSLLSPGATLARVNDLLCGDIPAHMFVTCMALVLDPRTGRIDYANAGHDLPYLRTADGVVELRATGMPLGLMHSMSYEERSVVLRPGDHLLLHSDGLAEAHSPEREMFGFGRVAELAGCELAGQSLIDRCLTELDRFSGKDHEQEDDITLVTLQCTLPTAARGAGLGGGSQEAGSGARLLDAFSLPSEPGNERIALRRVAEAVQGCGLSPDRVERLKTAVAEAAMNAIEHGNANRADLPVEVRVSREPRAVVVDVTDRGVGRGNGDAPEDPDLEEKLAGRQAPRGWGLFLIKEMVDEVEESSDDRRHTVRLTVGLVPAAGEPGTPPVGEGGCGGRAL